jgi:RNA polymerase sigma-70 factor (ECF subfamily)
MAVAASRPRRSCVDPLITVTPASDTELVAGLRAGDTEAFDAAYARHAPRLFRFLVHLCARRHVAEDVLQETWLKLATHAPELRPETELGAWLFTVARNGWLSRARVESRVVELGSAGERAAPEPTPESRAVASSAVRALERALSALGNGDREILLLVGVEEMSPATARAVLGLGEVAFRQRLHRARSRLASELERAPRLASSDWTEK